MIGNTLQSFCSGAGCYVLSSHRAWAEPWCFAGAGNACHTLHKGFNPGSRHPITRAAGLVVWFSLRVPTQAYLREVPGSIPGWPRLFAQSYDWSFLLWFYFLLLLCSFNTESPYQALCALVDLSILGHFAHCQIGFNRCAVACLRGCKQTADATCPSTSFLVLHLEFAIPALVEDMYIQFKLNMTMWSMQGRLIVLMLPVVVTVSRLIPCAKFHLRHDPWVTNKYRSRGTR